MCAVTAEEPTLLRHLFRQVKIVIRMAMEWAMAEITNASGSACRSIPGQTGISDFAPISRGQRNEN